LVHGIPTSSWSYRNVAADLAHRGCRVIVRTCPVLGPATSHPSMKRTAWSRKPSVC
jgi:hypothetical protein